MDIVPPGSSIHQLNVESTLHAVCCDDGWLYADCVLGTDSHAAVSNGLGVFSIGEYLVLNVESTLHAVCCDDENYLIFVGKVLVLVIVDEKH